MPVSKTKKSDPVNAPDHYRQGDIEAIDAIEASMSPLEFRGYLKGNVLKYLWRYDYKGKALQDLRKADWYLLRLMAVVEPDKSTDEQRRSDSGK